MKIGIIYLQTEVLIYIYLLASACKLPKLNSQIYVMCFIFYPKLRFIDYIWNPKIQNKTQINKLYLRN